VAVSLARGRGGPALPPPQAAVADSAGLAQTATATGLVEAGALQAASAVVAEAAAAPPSSQPTFPQSRRVVAPPGAGPASAARALPPNPYVRHPPPR
jgi:hypothetical protein